MARIQARLERGEHKIKKAKKAGVSYRESLVEDLRGDDEAQLEYIKANFKENGDIPSAILTAIRTVSEARGFKNYTEEVNLNRTEFSLKPPRFKA